MSLDRAEEKSFLERTEEITIETIKESLTSQDYETLSLGNDKNGVHCLLVAKLRAKADIQSTGHIYDESIPEVRLALMKLWIYEMYAFVGENERASSSYEDYTLIIKTCFGSIHIKGESESTNDNPAVAVVKVPKEVYSGR